MGIADGLNYLHNLHPRSPILHGDIKGVGVFIPVPDVVRQLS